MLVKQETFKELDSFLLELLQLIKTGQIQKDLYASGDSAKSLRVEVTEGVGGVRGQLIDGSGSFEYQERGRGPGGVNWSKIYNWLQYKKYGFDWQDEKQRKQMAFAIFNKIKKHGTFTHVQKNPTGVVTEVINMQLLDQFIGLIASRAAASVSSDFVKGLRA